MGVGLCHVVGAGVEIAPLPPADHLAQDVMWLAPLDPSRTQEGGMLAGGDLGGWLHTATHHLDSRHVAPRGHLAAFHLVDFNGSAQLVEAATPPDPPAGLRGWAVTAQRRLCLVPH